MSGTGASGNGARGDAMRLVGGASDGTLAATLATFLGDDPTPPTREWVEGVCRQIDVRRRLGKGVSAAGGPSGDGEAGPNEAAAAAALLLGLAARPAPPPDEIDDGFALKCLNSALKALDLADRPDATADVRRLVTELRTQALGLVDRIGRRP